jgi:hypothetical protein
MRVTQVGWLGAAEWWASGECREENRAQAVDITLLRELARIGLRREILDNVYP